MPATSNDITPGGDDRVPDEEVDAHVMHLGSIAHFAGGEFYEPFVAPERIEELAIRTHALTVQFLAGDRSEEIYEQLKQCYPETGRCLLEWSKRFDGLVQSGAFPSDLDNPLPDIAHIGVHLLDVMIAIDHETHAAPEMVRFHERKKEGVPGWQARMMELALPGLERIKGLPELWQKASESPSMPPPEMPT